MASLVTIPPELQLSILDHIPSNGDRKRLCLTCKAWQSLVTPLLYKDIDISACQLTPAFASTLTAGHPGIPHIRTIQIRERSNSLDHITKLGRVKVTRLIQLISLMPQNVLTRFHLPTTVDVPFALDLVLRGRQQSLTNRQYHSPAWRTQSHLIPSANELAHITTLQLYIQQPDDYGRAGVLIGKASGVKILSIEFEHGMMKHYIRLRRLQRGLNGPFQHEQDIVWDLFRSIDSTIPRADLVSLRIKSVPLDELTIALPTRLPLRALKHLHLDRCTEVGPFLRKISQLKVDLVSYGVSFASESGSIMELNDDILELMTSPRSISIRDSHWSSGFHSRKVCSWTTLSDHAANLKSLRIYDDLAAEAYSPWFLPGTMMEFSNF